jgi:hypothetical protein
VRIVLAPTVTKLPEGSAGAVLVTGSHGGLYSGALALKAGIRAFVCHDAGIGAEEAGVASLLLLQRAGLAAAAVSHLSARIGDPEDMMRRGTISRPNRLAAALGVVAGMPCQAAAERLGAAPLVRADAPSFAEARGVTRPDGAVRDLVLIDSAALVDADADAGAVIVTGSHGGLVGGSPSLALRADGFAAAFNDAGIGIDRAGVGRLTALDARGIAAITVSAASARIGDARSTLRDGVISAANDTADALGAEVGLRAKAFLIELTRRRTFV